MDVRRSLWIAVVLLFALRLQVWAIDEDDARGRAPQGRAHRHRTGARLR